MADSTYPAQCSLSRQGSFIMIKEHPCKIVAMSTSKTGKHGHAKCKFMAVDIFDGSKHEMVETSTHNVTVPNVVRTEYTCMDVDDEEYLTLMDQEGTTREDVKLPEEGGYFDTIRKLITQYMEEDGECIVTILKAPKGKDFPYIEMAIDCKKASQ